MLWSTWILTFHVHRRLHRAVCRTVREKGTWLKLKWWHCPTPTSFYAQSLAWQRWQRPLGWRTRLTRCCLAWSMSPATSAAVRFAISNQHTNRSKLEVRVSQDSNLLKDDRYSPLREKYASFTQFNGILFKKRESINASIASEMLRAPSRPNLASTSDLRISKVRVFILSISCIKTTK